MTAFSAVIFYLLPSSSSGLTGVYDRHVYSDGVKWDLRDSWVLSSDEITVFMCAGFQTEWLSDRACKFPQVSPLSLPPWCHGWHCCCWVTTATWVLYKKKSVHRADVITRWFLLLQRASHAHAARYSAVQPGVCPSHDDTQPHVIPVLNPRTPWQKLRLL